jgi:hypothetical protein
MQSYDVSEWWTYKVKHFFQVTSSHKGLAERLKSPRGSKEESCAKRVVMKDQSCTDEITQIFQEAAPARQALLDNYNNLMNVAEYCENNYLQVRWKFSADTHLGHGLSYTVASRHGIAYQLMCS